MTFGVDEGVALNAFNFLARIIADRINGDPPFSVAFATCVSMIDAVGSPSFTPAGLATSLQQGLMNTIEHAVALEQ